MYKNVFYQSHINIIGGVETFLYELAKLSYYNKRDLTIIYRTADKDQVERLRKYCRIMSLAEVEKPIICERAFFNYGLEPIDDIQAKEYIQIEHADFKSECLKNYPPNLNPKLTKFYAVSENNAKSFFELTGIEADVLYNPLTIEEEPRIMTLVSPQRLTPEKGGKRIEQMVKALDTADVPYVWHIFSDQKLSIVSPNIMYHQPTLDVRRWIKHADYLVLLSDTEGFPYSAYESLCLGTPLIITRLAILDELGCTEDNSIVLDFDMSNMNVLDIYNRAGTFNFAYTPKSTSKWLSLLKGKSTYVYVPPKDVTIRALRDFYDIQQKRLIPMGTEYVVKEDRAKEITDKGYAVVKGDTV